LHLPVTSASATYASTTSVLANSSSAFPSVSYTKLTRPFVLHEHITSTVYYTIRTELVAMPLRKLLPPRDLQCFWHI